MTETQEKKEPLYKRLLEGLTVKSRDTGDVHTIKGNGGHTVAEVCVGKTKTRLNFKSTVGEDIEMPEGIVLGGNSKSWRGGGTTVTEENLAGCRSLLEAVIAADVPTEEPEEATSEEAAETAAEVEEAGKNKGGSRRRAAAGAAES